MSGFSQSPLFESEAFRLYPDKVIQGNFEARAVSPFRLESNYQSPANAFRSAEIEFKFAVNGRDNELPVGVNHRFRVPESGDVETPVIRFGQPLTVEPGPLRYMSSNRKATFRLDFREQKKKLDENGFFILPNGQKIIREEFKGIFIAGGIPPLGWDFDNLDRREEFKLEDLNGDGIYQITLSFNPHSDDKKTASFWTPRNDLKAYPSYQSPFLLSDALYHMALDEMVTAIEPDSTFRTGKEWAGVWTRDISYSILLSMAVLQPRVAMISLKKKVKNKRVIQDTGTGGAWPVSTDRMIWAVAAFEIYKVTGDRDWLLYAFEVVRNSLEDDQQAAADARTGLVRGESSFLDWREQTYPRWMQPADIYASRCLGTNAVHFQACSVLSEMAGILGDAGLKVRYATRANEIRDAINRFLWMEEKGYYGQFLYGRNFDFLSPRSEALGEALCVWFGIAPAERAQKIVSHTPVGAFGIPCIHPQIPGIPPYHNRAVWPFVQSYWALAAAKAGNEASLVQSFAAIYRPAALFVTNKENFVSSNGDYAGTVINSSNMLWSLSGSIGLVYRVLFGMRFEQDGIRLEPFVPHVFGGKRTLRNFRYRKAILDFSLEGSGNRIAEIRVDGKIWKDNLIPAGLEGFHSVAIRLEASSPSPTSTGIQKEAVSPETPVLRNSAGQITWEPVPGAEKYRLYKNGLVWKEVIQSPVSISKEPAGEFSMVAIGKEGVESFASEPVWWPGSGADETSIPLKEGKDLFIRIGKNQNTELTVPVVFPEDGAYAISFQYANGNGPVNTENKCAIRTLREGGSFLGTLVFPQRGIGEWSNVGYSNWLPLGKRSKGSLNLRLVLEAANENMNGEVNEARLHGFILRRLPE